MTLCFENTPSWHSVLRMHPHDTVLKIQPLDTLFWEFTPMTLCFENTPPWHSVLTFENTFPYMTLCFENAPPWHPVQRIHPHDTLFREYTPMTQCFKNTPPPMTLCFKNTPPWYYVLRIHPHDTLFAVRCENCMCNWVFVCESMFVRLCVCVSVCVCVYVYDCVREIVIITLNHFTQLHFIPPMENTVIVIIHFIRWNFIQRLIVFVLVHNSRIYQ